MILTYKISANEERQKISTILKSKLKISSRLLVKLKMNQKILVNNEPVFSNYIVKENDEIVVKIDFEEDDYIIPEQIDLDIIYEDESLLIINKPAGIVVHPSSYHPNNTLANGVKYYLNNKKKIRPVNRLDKETSGIVIFAKNEYIQEILNTSIDYKKEYLAIISGTPKAQKGTISAPIARKPSSIMEREVNFENGQSAITHYYVLKTYKEENLSFVHIILETGRTHQIRVHFSYIGHKLLGDTLYGEESKLIKRQALHAWKVSFIHPITHQKITLTADLPQDMRSIISELNKN